MSATARFVKPVSRPTPTTGVAPVAAAPKPTAVAVGGAGHASVMFDSIDDAKAAVVHSAFEYVTDAPALIGLLYRTRSLYDSCPPSVPSSELGRGFSVHEHFNHPPGMKALNVMLRHTYNFFNDIARKMNFNDYEACASSSNIIFFRARHVRNEIATVFAALSDTASTTKYKAAQSLFNRIKDCIISLPPTPAERERERERMRDIERRAALAAAAEEARRAELVERAKKAASDAFAAEHGVRPEDCW